MVDSAIEPLNLDLREFLHPDPGQAGVAPAASQHGSGHTSIAATVPSQFCQSGDERPAAEKVGS